ncbi:hypothetical protein GZL_07314 [Streptomyces sp. 769]|nr:hypothetical protein GZL_07314 [Streptomyces sp. 769]
MGRTSELSGTSTKVEAERRPPPALEHTDGQFSKRYP